MGGLWQGMLANMAVVAAVLSLWANLRGAFDARSRTVQMLAFGVATGTGALLAMMLAIPIMKGIFFDLRAAPLAIAGFFGGPLAAAVAGVSALAYRAWMGGSGVLPGSLAITVTASAACLLRRVAAGRPTTVWHIVALAVMTGAVHVGSIFVLPRPMSMQALLWAAAPTTVLDFAAVLLAGLSMVEHERRRGLVASNALHRAIIDALPDSLSIKDLDGRFRTANPATARLMGAASADDLIGRTDFDFYPAEVAQRFRDDEARVVSGGQSMIIDQQATFAEGRLAWLSTLKVPVRDETGAIVGLITHNRDVTASHTMANELQATRQRLSVALAQMADGLVMYDAHGTILMCNEQYRALFPLTADARVPGGNLGDVLRLAAARGEQALPSDTTGEAWAEATLARYKTEGHRTIALAEGRWIEARTRALPDGTCLTVLTDITARKQLENSLRHRAEHDPLTGLANRAAFLARLERAHAHAAAQGGAFAVVLVDLDRFKQVNDGFGHQVGDDLLVEVARRLEAVCRSSDLVSRLGGDEFAIVCEGASPDAGTGRLVPGILEALTKPFDVGGVTLMPGCSIGYTVFPEDPGDPGTLVAHADRALYAAKASGRRRWVVYAEDRATAAAG